MYISIKIRGEKMYRELDEKTLKKLHEVELKVLFEIDRMCKENDINYFLVYGSLLGAVRHQGFIPWDDDIDIGMLREDYEKFIKLAPHKLESNYSLHCFEVDDDYWLPFAKVRKKNTLFNEKLIEHLKVDKGIGVDIFSFDHVSEKLMFLAKLKATIVRNISNIILVKKRVLSKKEIRHKFFSFLLLLPVKSLFKIQKFLMTREKDSNSTYISSYTGTYKFHKECLKREVFLPLKRMKFENFDAPVMNNPDAYLTSIYGDYMKLPPKEKRINHCVVEISFDTKKDKKDQ